MPDATRESQVAREILHVEKAIQALAEVVARTEERLRDVLAPEADVKGRDEPQQELVPLAQKVRALAEHIEREAERLNDILARIEL